MKKCWIAFLVLVLSCPILAWPADSPLVELAKKEKERRAKLQNQAKTITNEDVDRYIAGKIAAGEISYDSEAELEEATDGEPAPPDATGKPKATEEQKSEQYWRSQYQAALGRVEHACSFNLQQALADFDRKHLVPKTKDGKIAVDPTLDSGLPSSGARVRVMRPEEFGKYRPGQEDARTDLMLYKGEREAKACEAAKRYLEEQLPEEARKAGALPDWVRE